MSRCISINTHDVYQPLPLHTMTWVHNNTCHRHSYILYSTLLWVALTTSHLLCTSHWCCVSVSTRHILSTCSRTYTLLCITTVSKVSYVPTYMFCNMSGRTCYVSHYSLLGNTWSAAPINTTLTYLRESIRAGTLSECPVVRRDTASMWGAE